MSQRDFHLKWNRNVSLNFPMYLIYLRLQYPFLTNAAHVMLCRTSRGIALSQTRSILPNHLWILQFDSIDASP